MSIKRYAAMGILGAAVAIILPTAKVEEGLALKPYRDTGGVVTWCYGDTGPVPKTKLTEKFCSDKLSVRMVEHCKPVAKAIKVPVTRNELAAICDFAYNVGVGGAKGSSVIRLLNKGDRTGAADAFLLWNKVRVKGVLVDCRTRSNNCYGVWLRRLKERALFLTRV